MSSPPINLIAVDTDRDFLARLEGFLGPQSNVKLLKAASGEELLALLREQQIHCVLLEYDLGTETGLSLMQRFKLTGIVLPPVVMMTGAGSEDIAVKAFRGGVADYLSKQDLNVEELLQVIRNVAAVSASPPAGIGAATTQSEPDMDVISGLSSRSHLEASLHRLETGRSGQVFAVIALRPRVFDDIVRTGGTAKADEIIAEFGRRVSDATRSSDVRGRWDEATFLCVIERYVTRASIMQLCAGLADRLKFEFHSSAWSFTVETEIGAATFTAGHGAAGNAIAAAIGSMERHAVLVAPSTAAHAGEEPAAAHDVQLQRFTRQETADAAERSTNRRIASRHRVLKRGRIGVNNHSTFNCTIRNLSDTGALLRIDGFFAAPKRFYLSIGDDFKRDVWLRWQSGTEAGVSFVPLEEGPLPQA